MIRRLTRSLIVLGVLLGAYQAYARFAVPLMEPSLEVRRQRQVTRDDLYRANNTVSNYQLLLSNYFPPDHWSQTRPPKVIANATEQAMLVFDEFKRQAGESNGQADSKTTKVDIERIALLVFPTPPREGITPPRDAVILEAPQGAHLEFDDFRPEIGQIGQITRGEFPGLIRIRSDMNEEGPEDDLLVETADMQMNTKLMYTAAPVRFRMGQNVGGGKELEIRFLADEHQKKDSGLKIGGIDSLEIRREVRMRIELDTSSLLPGDKAKTGAPQANGGVAATNPSVQVADAKAPVPPAPKPPADISCSGPFTFDFVRYVASLDRDVELRQVNPNGPSDQLSCNRLDLHFAPKLPPSGQPQPVVIDPGKRQQRDLGNLEPAAIVAEGHPVVVTSPEKKAYARGDRIQIALRDQRLRISGASDAQLVFGLNKLQAPLIDYQHPTRDEATTIGRFRATGPGSLHFVADPTKPEQVFKATWQKSVQLGRDKGQPVLVLDGQPILSFGDAGSLTSEQITIYLRELDGQSTAGLAVGSGGGNKLRLAPDRVNAVGRVEIRSPQLTGRTRSLSATFKIDPQAAAATNNQATNRVAANPASVAAPSSASGLNLVPGGNSSGPPQQAFHVDADQMRLEVLLRGQSGVPSSLACDGNVVFREVPLAATDQQPLEIRGGQLTVDRLDSKTPHVTLSGVAPGKPPGSALAQISGRGVTVSTDIVELDAGKNRMWSDGPGKATLLVARNLQGQATATPFPMEITWQGGLKFDGTAILFDEKVLVSGMDGTLRCDRLSAKLASPIKLGQHIDQSNINLSEIECLGGVAIENLTRDAGGVTSHTRAQLARLAINQQTGVISGDGPGVIRATRYGNGLTALAAPPGAAQQSLVAAPPSAAGSKLYFLRVDFHRGLGGNLYTRELTFHERVRTVYGPVDSWEQELDLSRPESLPPDSIKLSCDVLRLNEDPLAARTAAVEPAAGKRPIGPVQLQAEGNVKIEGEVPAQGEFSVQANRASYEQAKDAFILEGDTRTPAKLWRRTAAGADSPPTEARKIRYVRSTGEVKVDGIQYFEIGPADIENARRQKAVK